MKVWPRVWNAIIVAFVISSCLIVASFVIAYTMRSLGVGLGAIVLIFVTAFCLAYFGD